MAEVAVNEPWKAAIVGFLVPEAARGAECQDLRMTRTHCATITALHQRGFLPYHRRTTVHSQPQDDDI